MSRFFLTRVCIEGFRGINNEGEPLELKFKTDAVNSVYAINGTGKSSIFDALCYAIRGDIPKLDKLQAVEKPEQYYTNKFHSTGNAIIVLDFESDDATSQKISIQVSRAANGARTVTSSSGYPDPNGFLASLDESFTLLDYDTFSTFIDHTPLERGRSFSSLLGLAVYSDFRQTLKTAIDTRALNSDLDISSLTFQAQSSNDAAALAVTRIETNFNALVGKSIEDITKISDYKDEAMKTLADIKLLSHELSGKTLNEVNFDHLNTIIKAAEGGKERVELSRIVNTIAKLDEIKDDNLDTIKTEVDNHKLEIENIIELYKKTKGKFCRNLYSAAEQLFKSGEWDNKHECPVCNQHSEDDLSQSVSERVKEYKEVDDAVATFQAKWQSSSWRRRLLSLENLVTPDLEEIQKLFRPYDNAVLTGKLSVSDYEKLVEYYEKLEARYTAAVARYTRQKNDIEERLPKSLVALTKQLEYARLFNEGCNEYDAASKKYDVASKKLTIRNRWQQFIITAAETYAEAEAELSKSKIAAIETEFKDMFAYVMGVKDIKPNLERDDSKEDLQVQLSEFHGLKDVSARALLSESYRNALAISVYLSAAINHSGVPRFMVLDDITSSFDSGHQINLMEYIRTRLRHPENSKGLQFIILSHDGIMRKYFDGQNQETGWYHQSIEGNPPGVITTQIQNANRIRTLATNFLNAGQVDVAQPWARQYLEFTLMQVIKKLNIPVPIDFAIRDHVRMISNCLEAIKKHVALHESAGDLILEPTQLSDFKNTYAPQMISNWVSHYETASGTSISAAVMNGLLDTADRLADCFKYTDTDGAGNSIRKWYKNLASK